MFKKLLERKLKSKLKDKTRYLPRGFQTIGTVAIISLHPKVKKYKKDIARAILQLYPRLRCICNKKAGITGKYRKPQLEVIAGKGTVTTHQENNCFYKLDVRKIMFAKGNINERARIASLVKKNEIIVDMFAGIGYFTIPVAKLANLKQVYAFELNPLAYSYLKENIKLNKVENKVKVIKGDCGKEVPKLAKKSGRIADRIIMGLLPSPKLYVKAALKIIKKRGIIHYHTTIKEKQGKKDYQKKLNEISKEAKKFGFKIKMLRAKKVKNYAPYVKHYTLDLQVL